MTATVLMTTYCRPQYLRWSLGSIQRQDLSSSECEIVVLNDGLPDGSSEIVQQFSEAGMPVRHLHTGHRNQEGKAKWRIPGYAFNIGIQQSKSDVIILTCSDIYHLNDSLKPLIRTAMQDRDALATVRDVYDDCGELRDYLQSVGDVDRRKVSEIVQTIKRLPAETWGDRPHTGPDMPFLMAISREKLVSIGGFDEDFTGYACDDVDLIGRLLASGMHYTYTWAEVAHVFHGVRSNTSPSDPHELRSDYLYNLWLLTYRREQIVRNVDRPWGVLQGADA
jgi:glycosyltransferase involved in cell wall biosynthesis